MDPPLNNVRVLAVEQYGAGPFGTLFLAMMGAEVVKIENPTLGGDVSRSIGPHYFGDSEESNTSLFYQGFNHNKKSIALDIGTTQGQSIFRKLATTADAVYTNLRGDVPAKLGLTYEHLRAYNERLVCAHLTGYGRDNERANRPGYDYIMQAEAAYFQLTGEPDGPPTRFGLSVVDFMTGVTMSLGLASCLFDAARSGAGRDVDVSLFDVALYNLNYVAMWYLNAGFEQTRVSRSAHFALVPCQIFETADSWIYIMCNKEKFWVNLCECIGATDLLQDQRFTDFSMRFEHRTALIKRLDRILRGKTTEEWMQEFAGAVPASAVLDLRGALENPFLGVNGSLVDCETEQRKTLQFLRNPIRHGGDVPVSCGPKLGEHTTDLLMEVGCTPKELRQLRDSEVIL